MLDTHTAATELTVQECLELLEQHHVGRVALNDDHGPFVVPVNYAFTGGTVVFRTAAGTKLDAVEGGRAASFQIDAVDEGRRLGWSVLVRGRLQEVTAGAEIDRLDALVPPPFVAGYRSHVVRVISTSITGRRIPLPARVPREWFEITDLGNVWFGQDGSDLLG